MAYVAFVSLSRVRSAKERSISPIIPCDNRLDSFQASSVFRIQDGDANLRESSLGLIIALSNPCTNERTNCIDR